MAGGAAARRSRSAKPSSLATLRGLVVDTGHNHQIQEVQEPGCILSVCTRAKGRPQHQPCGIFVLEQLLSRGERRSGVAEL